MLLRLFVGERAEDKRLINALEFYTVPADGEPDLDAYTSHRFYTVHADGAPDPCLYTTNRFYTVHARGQILICKLRIDSTQSLLMVGQILIFERLANHPCFLDRSVFTRPKVKFAERFFKAKYTLCVYGVWGRE